MKCAMCHIDLKLQTPMSYLVLTRDVVRAFFEYSFSKFCLLDILHSYDEFSGSDHSLIDS
jgi:hypothetical protein